ncbi:unnamed protein product [Parnassius apollo]|uniref:(apollo) hypothetical protein n=1 Tax=Parnassius apollo TaxID=110799 RepID=A0A8S3WQR3_PARAO|nr:unnamed protein product [Parnassius apollo]
MPSRGLEEVFSVQSKNADLVKLHPVIKEHREELKRLIKVLNNQVGAHSKKTDSEVADEPNLEDVQVEEQVTRLKALLKLLQKNYDYQVHYEKQLENPSKSRVYFIENPEVLEDFRRNLRREQKSTSSESSDSSDFDGSSKGQLSNYRQESLTQIDDKDAASRDYRDRYNNEKDNLNPSDYFFRKSIAIQPRTHDILKEIRFPNRFKIANGKGEDVRSILRNNVNENKKRSDEIYDSLYLDIKDELSLEKVKESHEKFDKKRKGKVKVYKPKRRPKKYIKESSKANRIGRVNKMKKYGRWANKNGNFKIERNPKVYKPKSRPKAAFDNYANSYTQDKISPPFGRTSAPMISKKSIYEEEE